MNLKKAFMITAALLTCGTILSAQTTEKSVREIIDKKYCDKLLEKGNLIFTHEDGSGNLTLLPESEYADTIKNNLVEKQDKHFYFTYETLYFIPNKITVQRSSEIARTISKLKGIKYYSNTRKKEVVLYKRAFLIENEKSITPLEDKNTGNADGLILYCLTDDNSFGQTRYMLNYFQSEKELLTVFTNKDGIGLGPIKVITPDSLVINLLIKPCKEGVVIYLCADLDCKKVPGGREKITETISSRVEAISKWFISMM